MNKKELKKALKPLIKECIKELIFEDGTLSTIISEVVKGTHSHNKLLQHRYKHPLCQLRHYSNIETVKKNN